MVRSSRVVAVLALLVTAATAADLPPSAAALQAMADGRDWPGLLAGTSRALALRGPSAAYDRYDLWTKKAEAQLQLGQLTPATQSLANAAKEPNVTDKQKDSAAALATLVKSSTPKGSAMPATRRSDERPDFLDPSKRPAALAAMLSAELGDLKQRIARFKIGVDAKAMADAARRLSDLRPVDRVVNGSSAQADALEKSLAKRFGDEVERWAEAAGSRLEAISAAQTFKIKGRYVNGVKRDDSTGVQGRSPQEDEEMRRYLKEAQALGKSLTTLRPALSEAGREEVLGADKRIEMIYYRAQGYAGVPENRQQ